MKTLKVFISQPMRGLPDEEVLRRRAEILSIIEERNLDTRVELIDTFIKKEAPENASPLWYLGDSIKLMSEADMVVFAKGWQSARGCRIEYECAKEYGINVSYESEKFCRNCMYDGICIYTNIHHDCAEYKNK